MSRFASILQSIGVLIALVGCAFKGSTKGNEKAMLFGCLGLAIYFGVALATGRTAVYVRFRGRVELTRENEPFQFWIFVGCGMGLVTWAAIQAIWHGLAA